VETVDNKVQVGDWICFTQLGSPTYGLVLYIIDDCTATSLGRKIVTTCGDCYESAVLEMRRR
jgi:hypothetical protein